MSDTIPMTDGQFEKIVEESVNFNHMLMRLSLIGVCGTAEECIELIIGWFFDERQYVPPEISEKLEKFILEIEDKEILAKTLLDKHTFGNVFQKVLSATRNEYEMFFRMSGYVRLVSKLDRKFVADLRDRDGNNMLMIIAGYLQLSQRMSLLVYTFGSDKNRDFLNMDSVLNSNPRIATLVRTLIVDAKCDPALKNNKGVCFRDYFSERGIKMVSSRDYYPVGS